MFEHEGSVELAEQITFIKTAHAGKLENINSPRGSTYLSLALRGESGIRRTLNPAASCLENRWSTLLSGTELTLTPFLVCLFC